MIFLKVVGCIDNHIVNPTMLSHNSNASLVFLTKVLCTCLPGLPLNFLGIGVILSSQPINKGSPWSMPCVYKLQVVRDITVTTLPSWASCKCSPVRIQKITSSKVTTSCINMIQIYLWKKRAPTFGEGSGFKQHSVVSQKINARILGWCPKFFLLWILQKHDKTHRD